MKTKIPFKKLNARGFAHDVGLVIFVVVFAIAGVGYLVATHADSCDSTVSGPVSAVSATPASESAVSSVSTPQSCNPVSSPTDPYKPVRPISPDDPRRSNEQLSTPPARRPVQYIHICVTGNTTYITQGLSNCLEGGTFQGDYNSSVPGTYYNVPCKTVDTKTLRYAYISSTETCPAGTIAIVPAVSTAKGEQLSIPPARRPVQYTHVCISTNKTVYVTQGSPNCLEGGTFQFNYASTVPGTYYNVACRTTSSTNARYAYISSTETCPAGTVAMQQ